MGLRFKSFIFSIYFIVDNLILSIYFIVDNFSEQVLLGNINTITEKCFFIGGNPNCICVARVPNVVEGD